MQAVELAPLIASAPFVTIDRFAAMSGYTEKAITRKIEDGVWLEGIVWFKAPDGRRLISVKGYSTWVAQGRA